MYKTKNYKIAFKTYKANLPVPTQCLGDPEQVRLILFKSYFKDNITSNISTKMN